MLLIQDFKVLKLMVDLIFWCSARYQEKQKTSCFDYIYIYNVYIKSIIYI